MICFAFYEDISGDGTNILLMTLISEFIKLVSFKAFFPLAFIKTTSSSGARMTMTHLEEEDLA